MSVRNKSTFHRFPQKTLETGSPAPTTEPPTLLSTLGPHHSTRGSLKSSTCNTRDHCLATFQEMEADPHCLQNPSKEALTQVLEKQRSGLG